jgi:hypothetical protein
MARGCFWVESGSRHGHEHFVDLCAHRGGGQCACEQWAYRCGPKVMAGLHGESTKCEHVKAARMFLSAHLPDLTPKERQHLANEVVKQWVLQESKSATPSTSGTDPFAND